MRNLLTSFLDQRETIGNLLAPFLTGQPQQFAQRPNPNMLLQGAEAAQQPAPPLSAPTEVLQKQVAEVPRAVDPMPTSSTPQAMPVQPPQSKSGGFFDGLSKFGESDFGQRLGDMMLGWGMGGTMQDSLSKGSQMIAAGNQDRKAKKQVNQTVEWLKSKGMDETEAQAVASDRASLNAYLIAMRKGVDPMQALQQRKMELEIKKLENPNASLINAGNGNIYNPTTGQWLEAPNGGVKDTTDIQNYKFAQQNGYTGSFTDYQTEKTRAAKSATIGGATIDFEGLPMVTTDPNTGKPDTLVQDEFLKGLPRETATLVKKVANYEMPITSVTSLRSGERQQLAQLVGMYDPTFDATQSTSRTQTRKDYSTGEMAKLASSTNLAIQHMAGMVDAHANLKNGSYPVWNTIANKWDTQTGGAGIKSFETYRLGVADELAKAFKGVGSLNMHEVEEWKNAISSSSSPEQLQGAVKSALHMLAARTETYNQRYEQNMGGNQAPSFLTKSSIKALEAMGIDPAELDPRYTAAPDALSEGAVPTGVDQSVWNVMTPEERALWTK